MKRIEALIRPRKLSEVTDALIALGVDDFTVTQVLGSGRQQGRKECYRGVEYTVEFVSRMRLEVLASEALSSQIVEAILTTARTGAAGDGMIFVYSFADAISVRIDDPISVADASASLPPDEHADVPEEARLSHPRMGAAGFV